jgi:hypothetical protein
MAEDPLAGTSGFSSKYLYFLRYGELSWFIVDYPLFNGCKGSIICFSQIYELNCRNAKKN